MLVAVMIGVLAAAIVLWHQQRKAGGQLRRAQEESFAHLRFPTYAERLSGAEVRVLRRDSRAPALAGLPPAEGVPHAEWWYCIGPRRNCFVAMALCERQWLGWQVRWVVRPLDENQLRSVLKGDEDRLWEVFGEVRGGGLPA